MLALAGGLVGLAVWERPVQAAPLTPGSVDASGFADLVSRVSPAVVSIQAERSMPAQVPGLPENFNLPPGHPLERFFREFQPQMPQLPQTPRAPRQSAAQGSGFVISPDGYIVTNNHVVAEADAGSIKVVFSQGDSHEARVVGTDSKTDLALLKISASEPLPYVEFASEDNVRVGDWVLAVGNPFGLGGTVTSGIVSARGRDIGAGPYDDFIQLDASINRGNSGGPAFDLNGNVVGVNTAIYSPGGMGNVGIGFAIPATVAQSVITQLRDKGRVARGWLGVRIQNVDDEIAESLGLPSGQGALVAEVMPDTPAQAAGLRPGDVVLRVNGEAVEDVRALTRLIADLGAGERASLALWRDGRQTPVPVTIGLFPEDEAAVLAKRDDAPASEAVEETWGLRLKPHADGVQVTVVDPGSEAARKGVQTGDVIISVSGGEVSSPADVVAQIDTARQEGREAVLVLLRSETGPRYVALRLPKA